MDGLQRERSYYEARMALSQRVVVATLLTAEAAREPQMTRASLDAWAEVGRLAVDARHEHSMLTRESGPT